MKNNGYLIAHPEEIRIRANIVWSKPYSYDVLLSGHADEDCDANFYAIVGYVDNNWWSFYIGMVVDQCVSDRHKNADHRDRLRELKANNRDVTFNLSLGVVHPKAGTNITNALIENIEGLLIYANWHEDLVNKKKIVDFTSGNTFQIINKGFIDHLEVEEIVYGVVYKNT